MSETKSHTRRTVDAKRITIPVTLLITIVVGVLPAAAMSGVGMYRLGLTETKIQQHDQELKKVDDRLDAHDLELNSQGNDIEYIKITLDEIKTILKDMNQRIPQ